MHFKTAGMKNQTAQFALLVRESPEGITKLLHFFVSSSYYSQLSPRQNYRCEQHSADHMVSFHECITWDRLICVLYGLLSVNEHPYLI
jgi:hypothetical protein